MARAIKWENITGAVTFFMDKASVELTSLSPECWRLKANSLVSASVEASLPEFIKNLRRQYSQLINEDCRTTQDIYFPYPAFVVESFIYGSLGVSVFHECCSNTIQGWIKENEAKYCHTGNVAAQELACTILTGYSQIVLAEAVCIVDQIKNRQADIRTDFRVDERISRDLMKLKGLESIASRLNTNTAIQKAVEPDALKLNLNLVEGFDGTYKTSKFGNVVVARDTRYKNRYTLRKGSIISLKTANTIPEVSLALRKKYMSSSFISPTGEVLQDIYLTNTPSAVMGFIYGYAKDPRWIK